MTKTLKFDQGKAPLSIIPKEALEYEARAFKYGAEKYGRNNFKASGLDHTRLLDAALRHIYAYAGGQNNDDESDLNHLGHARANLAMLIYMLENNKGKDDR